MRAPNGGSGMLWAGMHHGARMSLGDVTRAQSSIRYRKEILTYHISMHGLSAVEPVSQEFF